MTKVSNVYLGLSRESESKRGTGSSGSRSTRWVVGHPGGVGSERFGVEPVIVAVDLIAQLGFDRDGDPHLATELAGEDLGDVRAKPALDEVLGELIGCGEQSGVLDHAHRPGQAEKGSSLRSRFVGQGVEDPVPHGGQVVRLRGHRCPSTSPR